MEVLLLEEISPHVVLPLGTVNEMGKGEHPVLEEGDQDC